MSEENQRVGIWNLLHDGEIIAIDGNVPGDLYVTVNIAYLRHQFPPKGDGFIITLHHCSLFQLTLWDKPTETSFTKIVASELEILSTDSKNCPIELITTKGKLEIDFLTFEISLDSGEPITYEQLDMACINYWDKWEKEAEARKQELNKLRAKSGIPPV